MLNETLSAVVIRTAESWQFFAFVFAALLTVSFGFIDEVRTDQKEMRWLRIGLKCALFVLLGYFTLFSSSGRNFLAGVLASFKIETPSLARNPNLVAAGWEAIGNIWSPVVALCALGLTFWQARTTRRHNRLSIKPYLTTWADSDYDENQYSVKLLNTGVGPALIKSFKIEVGGTQISGMPSDMVEKALKVLFPDYNYKSSNGYVGPGYMMSAKEERALVNVTFNGSSLPKREEVAAKIKTVRLLIEYESIYEEKFSFDSDKYRLEPVTEIFHKAEHTQIKQ